MCVKSHSCVYAVLQLYVCMYVCRPVVEERVGALEPSGGGPGAEHPQDVRRCHSHI